MCSVLSLTTSFKRRKLNAPGDLNEKERHQIYLYGSMLTNFVMNNIKEGFVLNVQGRFSGFSKLKPTEKLFGTHVYIEHGGSIAILRGTSNSASYLRSTTSHDVTLAYNKRQNEPQKYLKIRQDSKTKSANEKMQAEMSLFQKAVKSKRVMIEQENAQRKEHMKRNIEQEKKRIEWEREKKLKAAQVAERKKRGQRKAHAKKLKEKQRQLEKKLRKKKLRQQAEEKKLREQKLQRLQQEMKQRKEMKIKLAMKLQKEERCLQIAMKLKKQEEEQIMKKQMKRLRQFEGRERNKLNAKQNKSSLKLLQFEEAEKRRLMVEREKEKRREAQKLWKEQLQRNKQKVEDKKNHLKLLQFEEREKKRLIAHWKKNEKEKQREAMKLVKEQRRMERLIIRQGAGRGK